MSLSQLNQPTDDHSFSSPFFDNDVQPSSSTSNHRKRKRPRRSGQQQSHADSASDGEEEPEPARKKRMRKPRAPRKQLPKANVNKAPKEETSTDIIQKRIDENKNQSLDRLHGKLYCQACSCNVTTHKGNCGKHLTTEMHKGNVEVWLAKGGVEGAKRIQISMKAIYGKSSERKMMHKDSVLAAVMCGLSGSGVSKYNKLMHKKYKFRNGSALVHNQSRMILCVPSIWFMFGAKLITHTLAL